MNNNKKENTPKSSLIGVAIVVVIALLSKVREGVSVNNFYGVGIVILAVTVIIAIVVAKLIITKMKQVQQNNDTFNHSHDRLSKTNAEDTCTVDEHWKNQLDGFFKVGIIDRNEYQVLLRRQATQTERIREWQERR